MIGCMYVFSLPFAQILTCGTFSRDMLRRTDTIVDDEVVLAPIGP
jgi:hypothetical protein